MRVLHFIHWPRSGITALVKDLVDASSGSVQYGVIFIVSDQDECKEMEKAGITVYDISGSGILGKLRRIHIIYKEFQPEIVHLHSFSPSLLHLLAVGNKIKTIRTIHNLYPYFYEPSIRSFMKRMVEIYVLRRLSSVITVVSNEIIQQLPTGFSRLNCRTILNGIKIPKTTDYNSSVAKSHNELKLLSIGRLEDQKGYDLLIKAISILSSNKLPINVTIVGDGTKRESLEALAKKLGVDKKINFTGYLPDPFNQIDATSYSGFISSSRYEGFGLAIAEAMAHRLPVITTKSGGLSNSLKDGWDAIVVNCSAEDMAEGIRRLSQLSDKNVIGMRGYELVSSDYSINKTVDGYEGLYLSETL